jgi:thioredoxin-related protein
MKLMNKLIAFFALLSIAASSCAQDKTASKAANGIPPYHILTTDSVYVTPANLPKDKSVLIVYFSPDCSHCQHMMYEMKPKMAAFKNTEVIMVTFVQQIKAIQVFARDFDLAKYPNFIVGTEGYTYVVQKYFDVHMTPYIALYDKHHKLVKEWEKAPSVDSLVTAVKAM